MLFNRNIAIIDALAFVTLFKYGMGCDYEYFNDCRTRRSYNQWCDADTFTWHNGVRGNLFYPRFKVTILGFIVSFIWVCINDVIDYGYGQFPYYDFIASHTAQIGVLSVCLSFIALILYLFLKRF